ncbi:MAG TPA: MerR family transcriptional regulator [Tepidisphaeraceae bacterium]|jgi:DNA-binding transcriptional MerR regulator
MNSAELSIADLADAAGLSRRAVRFYVQQGLLPPPRGRGRGSHYDGAHLDRLRRILELQQAGHSLDAIRRILDGRAVAEPAAPTRRLPRANLSAELWTRLKLMEGVELHFDTARHNPEVEKLLALRDVVREVFAREKDEVSDEET